jgi:protein-tyrosine phosphatase
MIDLHCHILPGVDDGPASLDEALWMARRLAADGVSHVFATPHCHRSIHLLRDDILPRVAGFNDQLREAGVRLTVLPGSEIQAADPAEYRREFEAGLFCHYGDTPVFTLLEWGWRREQYPEDAAGLVRWVRERGTTPIIAHPERYPYFQKDMGMLRPLAETGAWMQVTVDSLLGNHGQAARELGEEVLRVYPDAVLATDAHSRGRCSGLSEGFAWVREHLSSGREAGLRSRAEQVLASARPA